MSNQFFDKQFEEETLLKLDIFRRYIREWISVFFTDSPSHSHVTSVNIFDLFCGPGADAAGTSGSPVIVAQEIRRYCETRSGMKAEKPIRMFFNDIEKEKIARLQSKMEALACKKGCCQMEYGHKPFAEIFDEVYPRIQNPGSANLVIMDQFGVSDVTPEVVQRLAECSMTDILFFIPSSYVYRFKDHPAFASKFNLNGRDLEYNTIHRFLRDYYKERLASKEYYLAPFSIKKGRNIHGVIFGSGHLRGLQKFLEVCWKIDPKTGEANYNVAQDPSYEGQLPLFKDLSISKADVFEKELMEFVETQKPDNKQMYRFVLEKGFCPSKANESLKRLQDANKLKTIPLEAGAKVRKGAFYLDYSRSPILRFHKVESAP